MCLLQYMPIQGKSYPGDVNQINLNLHINLLRLFTVGCVLGNQLALCIHSCIWAFIALRGRNAMLEKHFVNKSNARQAGFCTENFPTAFSLQDQDNRNKL